MNSKTTKKVSPLTELLLALSENVTQNDKTISGIKEIVLIEKQERSFMKMDESLNSSYITYNGSAFASAELKVDKKETIILRNSIGLKTCDSILYLNMLCKEVTGRKFLETYYDIDKVKTNQENVDIFYSLMKEYDDALELAIKEISKIKANKKAWRP